MKTKRGVTSYSFEEHLDAARRGKYLSDHHKITLRMSSYTDIFDAQFHGTYFHHAFDLIKTSLTDYFLYKKNLFHHDNIRALYEDLCGWRIGEFIDYLKSENIDLSEFKYHYLKYSDFCYELFSYKEVNGFYALELPNETRINIDESDFFALSILSFNLIHPTDHKEEGYWFTSPEDAYKKWDSTENFPKELIDVSIFYDKVVNTEYWFSIINELFAYFQNALIRSGEKIAISKEKSRVAKIKADKYRKNNEPAFKHIEELWDTGQWAKASKCAEDIFNLKEIELPYTTVYNHLRSYIKSKK
ncbi:hypothetical protein H2787_04020 [Acinetobacter baumannii]|nr:hypothetical protein H2787_04020 [Acinetobacter baumannii]